MMDQTDQNSESRMYSEQDLSEFTAHLIRATAEATAEAIVARVGSMLMPSNSPGVNKQERNVIAEIMRSNGLSYGKIGNKLNISRAQAYQITKHVKQSKHVSQ